MKRRSNQSRIPAPPGGWPCIIDLEASSLGDDSYPIEVAWLESDGSIVSHLIQPHWSWTDWSAKSAALHGITRENIKAHGMEPRQLCGLLADAWAGRMVLSDAPDWDGHWLKRLWQAGGQGDPPWKIADLDGWLENQLFERIDQASHRKAWLKSAMEQANISSPPSHRAAVDVANLIAYCRIALQP